MSIVNQYRSGEAEQALAKAGFSEGSPIALAGATLEESGADRARVERAHFENLPSASEASAEFNGVIRAEVRQDMCMPGNALRMLDSGRVTRGSGEMPLTHRAMSQMVGLVSKTPRAPGYVCHCPGDLRAYNANYWFAKYADELRLRTRLNVMGTREAFAVVSDGFAAVDVDAVVGEAVNMALVLGDGPRAIATYDGQRATFNVIFAAETNYTPITVGDVFKVAIRVSSADDGSAAIHIGSQAHRVGDRSFFLVSSHKHDLSRRHVGDKLKVLKDVQGSVIGAFARVIHFTQEWAEASRAAIVCDEKDPRQVFIKLINRELLGVPNVNPDDLLDRLMRSWAREPFWTRTAFAAAVARVAHEERWPNIWTCDALEAQAGKLIAVKKWWAPHENGREDLSKRGKNSFDARKVGAAPTRI